jgi:uncharacterized protein (TIGR02147 family)
MSEKNYVFDYQDYREFLIEALGGKSKRTGQRGALARHLGCQTAFLSQVLHGTANLTLEQAFKVNQFFSHDPVTAEFFLLLVQKDRAGTHELKSYFQNKMTEILNKRSEISSRITKNRAVSESDQAYYYSYWYIGAIHVAISIPELQTAASLAKHFHLEDGVVREALDFLVNTGLAKFEKQKFSIGPSHIHLPKDSKFIHQLHSNWRMQALQSLEKKRDSDLHYSVAYTLSRADVEKIRQQILQLIEHNMSVVRPSAEEVLYCNTIDFFELKR